MGRELEALIDQYGLCAVLESIASICGEKAEHVQVNWQDRDLSKAWTEVRGHRGRSGGTREESGATVKARDNRAYVERCRDRALTTLARCIREHWTSDKFTEERNHVPTPVPHTRGNAGEIWGYQRACWDAVWIHVEWRLGFADVSSAYPPHGFPFGNERTIPLPTHGAHFWKGTNDLFTAWEPLDKPSNAPGKEQGQ